VVEALRFRPNFVLDLPEDPLLGQLIEIGGALLRIELPTPRCIVPSLLQPDVETPVPDLLRVLTRHHRAPVGGLGEAACFGFYAQVLIGGTVSLGEAVRLRDS